MVQKLSNHTSRSIPGSAAEVLRISTKSTVTHMPQNSYYASKVKLYRFAEDHDQAMVELIDLIVRSGMTIGDIQERILDISNDQVRISYSTISNWLEGKTKKPQNFTLNWVGAAVGYTRKWTRA